MLQKVTRLDSVPTAEETVLTTEVPTKESRLYTLLVWRKVFGTVLSLATSFEGTVVNTSLNRVFNIGNVGQ